MKNLNLNTQYFIVLLLFVVGAMNSIDYFNYMGLSIFSRLLTYAFYLLIVITTTLLLITLTLDNKRLSLNFFPYWFIIIIAIFLKMMILFIQFPTKMFFGGSNVSFTITFLSIATLIIIITNGLYDLKFIKMSIWSLGIGLIISSVIPLLFYPEMIGRREGIVNGYEFSGGFWNSGVIGFLSVGWLLIALSINEKSKIKRIILYGMFFLFALTGLAGLSRALILSIVFSILIYLVIANKLKQYLKFIVLGIIVSVVFIYIFNDIIENLMFRFEGGINIQEETRVNIWSAYLANIADFFWFGEITGDYKKYTRWVFGPHSAPLNWFVQFGVLGLLGFLALLLGVVKSIRYISKEHVTLIKAALYAWLVAYVSISFINETGYKDLSLFSSIAIIYAWGMNGLRTQQKGNKMY